MKLLLVTLSIGETIFVCDEKNMEIDEDDFDSVHQGSCVLHDKEIDVLFVKAKEYVHALDLKTMCWRIFSLA